MENNISVVTWLATNLFAYKEPNPIEIALIKQAKEIERQQQGYSEEDMLKSFIAGIKCESNHGKNFEQFIEQFKNK